MSGLTDKYNELRARVDGIKAAQMFDLSSILYIESPEKTFSANLNNSYGVIWLVVRISSTVDTPLMTSLVINEITVNGTNLTSSPEISVLNFGFDGTTDVYRIGINTTSFPTGSIPILVRVLAHANCNVTITVGLS